MNKFNQLIKEMIDPHKHYFLIGREYNPNLEKFTDRVVSISHLDYIDPADLSNEEQQEFEELLVKNPKEDPSYREDVEGDVIELTVYDGIESIVNRFYCLKHNMNHLIGLIDRFGESEIE